MIKKVFFFKALLIYLIILFQGCGINSNLMFKTPKGTVNDSIPLVPEEIYRISPDDKIRFTLSTNKGATILVGLSGVEGGGIGNNVESNLEFTVRKNGEVELPVIGNIKVAGLSIEECEDELEKQFAIEYQEPFVQVRVTNQRVIVFPGNGSDARVVILVNPSTTLMETIALAGGITERGKANTIKIMRMVNGKREIYTVDLSTIDGLKYADLIVQANDYIYIEPVAELPKEIVQETAPIISILSSLIFIVFTLNKL